MESDSDFFFSRITYSCCSLGKDADWRVVWCHCCLTLATCMSYIDVLSSRIADYCQHRGAPGSGIDFSKVISEFLKEHSIRISDEERLRSLEYQVRAEIQRRLLEARLKRH